MIRPVSSAASTPPITTIPPKPQPTAAKPASTQDTVHLSSKALAGGDADHDGDSH